MAFVAMGRGEKRMSDELIRRQDVLDTLCKTCGGVGVNGCGVYGIDYPCDEAVAVGEIPSVDAVEVVRCKDCKYGRPYKHTRAYVACEADVEPVDRDKDFFCADGERKEINSR